MHHVISASRRTGAACTADPGRSAAPGSGAIAQKQAGAQTSAGSAFITIAAWPWMRQRPLVSTATPEPP